MMRRAVLPVLSLLLVTGAVVYVLSTNASDERSPASDERATTQAVSEEQPEQSEADCSTPAEPPPPEAAPPPPPPGIAMILPCGPGESEPAVSAPNHP